MKERPVEKGIRVVGDQVCLSSRACKTGELAFVGCSSSWMAQMQLAGGNERASERPRWRPRLVRGQVRSGLFTASWAFGRPRRARGQKRGGGGGGGVSTSC